MVDDRDQRVDHVVDLIDGVLEEWAGSVDAMRWTPPEKAPLIPSGGSFIVTSLRVEGVAGWTEVYGVPEVHLGVEDLNAGLEALRTFQARLRVVVEEMTVAINRAGEAMVRAFGLEPEPDDLRERALYAQRHRGTGPTQMNWRHRGQ